MDKMKKGSKTIIKISLLGVGVIFAVIAVFVFVKTRMNPPMVVKYENQYVNNINELSSNLSSVSDAKLEEQYQLIKDRIALFSGESLIDSEQKSACEKKIYSNYVKAFYNWSENVFSGSAWLNSDLALMKGRIPVLRNAPLESEDAEKVDAVNTVLTDYDKAWRLGEGLITSSDESRNRLAQASTFKSDSHLSHCASLMEYLNNLPDKLQNKHHAYVAELVEKLDPDNYYLSQIKQWSYDYKNAKSKVEDYNNNARELYGTGNGDFLLEYYYSEASDDFYDRLSDNRYADDYWTWKDDYYSVF